MAPTAPKRVLIMCTGNRCRSQMAEGWLRHFGDGRIEVYSAGTCPKGVHPLVVQVMANAGVDISFHVSDHIDTYANEPFDSVITVCDRAKEACPTFPTAKHVIHHPFEDPDQNLPTYELHRILVRICNEIRDWAEQFSMQDMFSIS